MFIVPVADPESASGERPAMASNCSESRKGLWWWSTESDVSYIYFYFQFVMTENKKHEVCWNQQMFVIFINMSDNDPLLCSDIHGPKRMNPSDSGDLLTLHLPRDFTQYVSTALRLRQLTYLLRPGLAVRNPPEQIHRTCISAEFGTEQTGS